MRQQAVRFSSEVLGYVFNTLHGELRVWMLWKKANVYNPGLAFQSYLACSHSRSVNIG